MIMPHQKKMDQNGPSNKRNTYANTYENKKNVQTHHPLQIAHFKIN